MWWPLQTAEVQLSVAADFTVSRVVLELVNFRHNYAGDVTVRLRAPSGALAIVIEEPVRPSPPKPFTAATLYSISPTVRCLL